MNSSVAPNSVSAGPRGITLPELSDRTSQSVGRVPVVQPPFGFDIGYSTAIIYVIALVVLTVHLARHVHRRLVEPGRYWRLQVQCRS